MVAVRISQIGDLDNLATSMGCQWLTMVAATLKLRIIVQEGMAAPFADVPARALGHGYRAVQANDLSHLTRPLHNGTRMVTAGTGQWWRGVGLQALMALLLVRMPRMRKIEQFIC